MRLQARLDHDQLLITITDHGCWRTPGEPGYRGCGLAMMRSLTSESAAPEDEQAAVRHGDFPAPLLCKMYHDGKPSPDIYCRLNCEQYCDAVCARHRHVTLVCGLIWHRLECPVCDGETRP